MSDLKPISDQSSLSISLPMLIQAVGLIGAMVWGYGVLSSRVAFLEHQAEVNSIAIEKIEDLQNAPIPSDVRQDALIRILEKEIDNLRLMQDGSN
tara:strand:- start:519 stop:803 length:285 start_codon:yes stop_codon:yes gene_type:complete